jgi:hypothetical protein
LTIKAQRHFLVFKNRSLTPTSGIPFASFFMYRMYGIPALQEQKAGDVQDVRYTGVAGAKSR